MPEAEGDRFLKVFPGWSLDFRLLPHHRDLMIGLPRMILSQASPLALAFSLTSLRYLFPARHINEAR